MTLPASTAPETRPALPAALALSCLQRVTLIVVTYNSAHCVPALAQGFAGLPHVVVVDNASTDATRADVQRLLPTASLLALPENRGFGVANNAALERVGTEFALLLNPDCVTNAKQIAALVQQADAWPEATLLVPQLLEASGDLQVNYSWPRDAWAPRGPAADGPLNVGYACAAVMLVRMARLRPLGFFDPLFFLYYEDEDLSLRVFQAQGQILVLPSVQITHLSRGSVKGASPWRAEYWRGYHHVQSKILFTWKHDGPEVCRRRQRREWRRAMLNVALRALLLSPKHLARAWGRLRGLRQLDPQALATARRPSPART